jgi:hypothetical protein
MERHCINPTLRSRERSDEGRQKAKPVILPCRTPGLSLCHEARGEFERAADTVRALNLHSAVLRSAPLVRATLPRVGIGRVSGLEAIIVTDRDGVIISKGARVARQSCSIQRAPYDLRPSVQSWRQIRNCRKRPSAVAHLRRTFSSRQSRHRISQSELFLGVAVTLQIRQATKLKLGKNKSITAFYDKRTVHHINNAPLVPPTSPSHMRPHRTCAYVVTTRPSPHAPRSHRANPPRAFTLEPLRASAPALR